METNQGFKKEAADGSVATFLEKQKLCETFLTFVWGSISLLTTNCFQGLRQQLRPQSSASASNKFWLTRNLYQLPPALCLHACLMAEGIIWLHLTSWKGVRFEDLPRKSSEMILFPWPQISTFLSSAIVFPKFLCAVLMPLPIHTQQTLMSSRRGKNYSEGMVFIFIFLLFGILLLDKRWSWYSSRLIYSLAGNRVFEITSFYWFNRIQQVRSHYSRCPVSRGTIVWQHRDSGGWNFSLPASCGTLAKSYGRMETLTGFCKELSSCGLKSLSCTETWAILPHVLPRAVRSGVVIRNIHFTSRVLELECWDLINDRHWLELFSPGRLDKSMVAPNGKALLHNPPKMVCWEYNQGKCHRVSC